MHRLSKLSYSVISSVFGKKELYKVRESRNTPGEFRVLDPNGSIMFQGTKNGCLLFQKTVNEQMAIH